MLMEEFYKIISKQKENNSYAIMLLLNGEHPIFKGHFPGQPVVPGACLLQMVKEVSEMIFEEKLILKRADSIKFVNPIDPNEDSILQLHIIPDSPGDITAGLSAILSNDDKVFFKFSGQFQPYPEQLIS